MLTRRLQLLVGPTQYDRLARYASERGMSLGEVVRDAIDRVTTPDRVARASALERFLAAAQVGLPEDPADLDAELDGLLDEASAP